MIALMCPPKDRKASRAVEGDCSTTVEKRTLDPFYPTSSTKPSVPRVHSDCGWVASLGLAALFLPLASAVADAVDVPGLEEIETGLRQRRDKIQSLYVETTSETSSPLTLEEFRRLPDVSSFYWLPSSPKVEYHYAFKGAKRYSRKIRHNDPGGPSLKASTSGARPEVSFEDQMRASNGTTLWARRFVKTVHPDGHVDEQGPTVNLTRPGTTMPFLYPPEYRAMNLGVAIAGPDLVAEDLIFEDLFYYDYPNLRELWDFEVSDQIEEVGDAPCAALSGTIEMTYTSGTLPDSSGALPERRRTRHVTFWLDLKRGLALRRWEESDMPGKKPLCRVVSSRFEEAEPGLWLPQQVELQRIAPTEHEEYSEQHRGRLVLSTRIEITKRIVNRVPDDVFDPFIKAGDSVVDLRVGSPPPARGRLRPQPRSRPRDGR